MRFLLLITLLAFPLCGCLDYAGGSDAGDAADSFNGGDDGMDASDCCAPDDMGDRGGDPGRCTTNQDCATPDNPPLPEDACCGCGAWCDSGRCTTMCVDAMCCFGGYGCGPNCEMLCLEHSHCFNEMRCIDGQCYHQPPPCGGDPDPNCHQGLEANECQATGGAYVCSPATMCWCICPTGDADCPCWMPDHCTSQCAAELQGTGCEDVRMSTCTGLLHLPPGCYCVADEDGTFSGLCID